MSTTIPTAKAMPARLMTLMLRPTSDMTRKVPTMEIGMEVIMIRTLEAERRKMSRTKVANAPPMKMLLRTRSMEEMM